MEPHNNLGAEDGERQFFGLFDDLINVMCCAKGLDGRYTQPQPGIRSQVRSTIQARRVESQGT